MNLIGLDIGTTRCKAVVFDPAGKAIGESSREYPVICDAPAKAEQDPELVWSLTKEILKEAVCHAAVREVAAFSASVQGDAVIAVDDEFRVLHPAILGMDYRSAPQAQHCADLLGGFELFARTGMRPHPMNSVTKVLFLKDTAPRIFDNTARIVTYAEYILGKLGAEPLIDHTMASRTMAFNLQSRSWDSTILDALGIPETLWSKPVPSATVAGIIRKDLAAELGLSPQMLLVTGGHDQTCAALGAGAINEKIGVISTGTAEVLSVGLGKPNLTRMMFDSYYPCYLHARDGAYFTFSLNHTGGILLKWWRDNFAREEVLQASETGNAVYALIDERMPEHLSPVLVLPHLNGSGTPQCDLISKGAIVGLTLNTNRHDISKAILESLCFELRINVDRMAACGIALGELRAAGGGAGSPRWLQLKADILNRPVRTLRGSEAACLGAALLAGVAAGHWKSLEEAVSQTVKFSAGFDPRPEFTSAYEERFGIYSQLYSALREWNEKL